MSEPEGRGPEKLLVLDAQRFDGREGSSPATAIGEEAANPAGCDSTSARS